MRRHSFQYWPLPASQAYNRASRAVYMYSQTGYAGCDYLLCSGHYPLYNANDHFQGPDSLCRGETLEHKLHSSKFV